MNWNDVTLGDIIEGLRECEWSEPPRPLREFFGKFKVPSSTKKAENAIKCNFYYFRTNYFILIGVCVGLAFLRNPSAILAVVFGTLSVLCNVDSFATAISNNTVHHVRKIHPPLAAKLRPPPSHHRSKTDLYICGFPRKSVVLVLCALSCILGYLTSAVVTITGALSLGGFLVIAHAAFKIPSPKAQFSSARDGLKTRWRGYTHGAP